MIVAAEFGAPVSQRPLLCVSALASANQRKLSRQLSLNFEAPLMQVRASLNLVLANQFLAMPIMSRKLSPETEFAKVSDSKSRKQIETCCYVASKVYALQADSASGIDGFLSIEAVAADQNVLDPGSSTSHPLC